MILNYYICVVVVIDVGYKMKITSMNQHSAHLQKGFFNKYGSKF